MDNAAEASLRPLEYHTHRSDLFGGRYANITDMMTFKHQIVIDISVGHNKDEQQSISMNFEDSEGNLLFEIVPDMNADGQYHGQCELRDMTGQSIVVIQKRESVHGQIKVKTPTQERLFDVHRRSSGGVKGHYAGLDVKTGPKLRFWLSREAFDALDNPTFVYCFDEGSQVLGTSRMMPADVNSSGDVTMFTTSYQINVPENGDAGMCALFTYMVHWAELRDLARQFEKAIVVRMSWMVASLGQLPDESPVEGPDGLAGVKQSVMKGYAGVKNVGLDLIGSSWPQARVMKRQQSS